MSTRHLSVEDTVDYYKHLAKLATSLELVLNDYIVNEEFKSEIFMYTIKQYKKEFKDEHMHVPPTEDADIFGDLGSDFDSMFIEEKKST